MNTWLCIDQGNTSAKLAIYGPEGIIYYARLPELKVDFLQSLRAKYNFETGLVSKTSHIGEETADWLETHHIETLSHDTKLPISIKYETPETLGRDRIAAAVGGSALYPGKNLLIIDIGTCITMDAINENREFLGGNISPGVKMRLRAMNHYTSGLPLAEVCYHKVKIGTNTIMALQNGAVRGTIYEIQSFIDDMHEFMVIFSGGDAFFFANKIKSKIFVHSNLVLEGLSQIIKFHK
jgi:type III pantothenate kinase